MIGNKTLTSSLKGFAYNTTESKDKFNCKTIHIRLNKMKFNNSLTIEVKTSASMI
jgi:hypothetical protein